MLSRAVLLVLLLLAAPLHAQGLLPILDAARVPDLDARGREGYLRFVRQNHPRAFALGADGRWGAAWGQASAEAAQAAALENCTKGGGWDCALYAVDNAIVWQDRAWAPAAPPGRFAGGLAFDLVPDGRFLWWGVREAAGVYVWAHGRSAGFDSRGQQPPPQLRWFNNARFDVMRFDRHPNSDDPDRAAGWLRESLLVLRGAGYRRIVVGGQSRGGWNALMMLAEPGLADAVVAIAPARHGDGAINNPHYPRATEDFHDLAAKVADRRARVVIAGFQGDPFVPDPAARSALVRTLLTPRVAGVLWLDRPEGFQGHGAGRTWRFSETYGACIFRFVTAASPPAGC